MRQYHILWVNVWRCPKRNRKRGMAMYASIFIWDYVKNMALKEHHSGTRISQMGLLRKKILRDFTIQCDTKIEAWRPDIAIIDKTKKEVKIIDVTIPGDVRVNKRNVGKTEKYKMVNDEMNRMGGGGGEYEESDCKVSSCRCISCNVNWLWKIFCSNWDGVEVEHAQKTASDSEDFETDTWMLKNSIISISNIEHSSVRPWTTGCCLLSQN